MRTAGLLTGIIAGALLAASSAFAVPIVITYQNAAGAGFYDPVLGPARRACIEAAAANWANRLQGTIPVQITATMIPLGGTASSAILGGAYARWTLSNFSVSVSQNVGYVVAEANQIAGYDLVTAANAGGHPDDDIFVQYNSDVDNDTVLSTGSFNYATDGKLTISKADGNGIKYYNIDFYQTCLHEMGHGLGFTSGFSQTTVGAYANADPLIYDTFLATGPAADAPLLTSLTEAQRAAALISDGLYWIGANARTAAGNTNPRIYAPTTYEKGSSTAHLDEATYLGTILNANINELMTPSLGRGVTHYPGPIVSGVFEDIGWNFLPYSVADATAALKDYAGLMSASEAALVRVHRYNLTTYPGHISLQDVVAVIRAAAGTETNPYILGTP